jgi:hypothetical protein
LLAYLDRFAASLKPDANKEESPTHPYRLYTLLCQAAWLYFNFNANATTLAENKDILELPLEEGWGMLDGDVTGGAELGQWHYENQQIIGLLNDGVMF